MPYDRHKATNRRAIFIALSIWLGTQALACMGVNAFTEHAVNALAIAGLVLMPPLLVWPWARTRLHRNHDEPRASNFSPEMRHKTLVTLEITSLCAVLIYLMMRMPA